ncbi:MAG: hypothetical protein K2F96_05790 [Muribaculaceae bacterium]|nr:hypothetical protein [Muribaculaceae bacterium]
MIRHLLFLIPLVALLAGCSTGACYDNQNSLPKAGFYSAATGDAVSVSGLSVGGFDAPNDSLLCAASETVTEVYLPFNPDETSTSFLFKSGVIADVVTFAYDTTPYFASAECGAVWRFRIRSVSWDGALVDSIAVVDSLITNVDAQQLKIFLNGSGEEADDDE